MALRSTGRASVTERGAPRIIPTCLGQLPRIAPNSQQVAVRDGIRCDNALGW